MPDGLLLATNARKRTEDKPNSVTYPNAPIAFVCWQIEKYRKLMQEECKREDAPPQPAFDNNLRFSDACEVRGSRSNSNDSGLSITASSSDDSKLSCDYSVGVRTRVPYGPIRCPPDMEKETPVSSTPSSPIIHSCIIIDGIVVEEMLSPSNTSTSSTDQSAGSPSDAHNRHSTGSPLPSATTTATVFVEQKGSRKRPRDRK